MTVVLSLWRGQMLVTVRSAREIIAEVAEGYGLTSEHLVGPDRTKRVSQARQEAMWACRQVKGKDGKPRYSYPFIGRLFGGRDHTTVLWGERQHAARLAGERVAA
jgi:chromosomal replication initiator protein